ncbi:MAG: nucleotidyltransferase domain-containing protein [Candidatus Xenobiia bacterium LiM19]
MDKNAVMKIIDRFRDAVEKQGIKVERLILYGSYAYGTPHEGSDIDLIIISEDFALLDFWQRIDVMANAICEVIEPIEAIAMTRKEWDNREFGIVDYAENGETVYAA